MLGVVAKVAVVGDAAVGKSALAAVGCNKPFPKKYDMTLGCDLAVKRLTHAGSALSIQLFDTSGHDVYTEMLPKAGLAASASTTARAHAARPTACCST